MKHRICAAAPKPGQPSLAPATDQVRNPLGPNTGRPLKSACFTPTLPDAPAGEYVVLHYQSHFDKGTARIETVTATPEADDGWPVSGYLPRHP